MHTPKLLHPLLLLHLLLLLLLSLPAVAACTD
jgi:hypothetical protein